jgi:hypothetical protein
MEIPKYKVHINRTTDKKKQIENILMATNHLLLYIHLCQCQWPRVLGVGLLPQTYWDCGFKSRQRHGSLSLVNCVFQVEVSVSGRSLIQSRPTECGVRSKCDREA